MTVSMIVVVTVIMSLWTAIVTASIVPFPSSTRTN